MYFKKGGNILREINSKLRQIEKTKIFIEEHQYVKNHHLHFNFDSEIANDFYINKMYKEIEGLLNLMVK